MHLPLLQEKEEQSVSIWQVDPTGAARQRPM
jgi:hypothetical protein